MKYVRSAVSILFLMAAIAAVTAAQNVSDEARRYFDRGMAAVELAKSPDDLKLAIAEFKQAIILAPDWADAYYNLGKVQEAAEMYREAVASLRKYLQLAPNASDADAVKSLINRIELKAEQVLTIPVIVDVMAEFAKPSLWKYTATLRSGDRQCRQAWSELVIERESSDSVKALSSMQYYTGPGGIDRRYQSLKVTGPKLSYVTRINVCDGAANRELGDCTSIMENEITVVSRTLVKVTQRVIRRGDGAGTAPGDVYECEFKKDAAAATASVDLFLIVSDREKVVAALASGLDVNAKNRFGNTLMQQAVTDGYADVAELLIANGADLTVRDQYGQTLLHLAAANGSVRIAAMLAEKGADIKATDNFGLLPLDKAVSARKKDAARFLISKGADIEAKDKYGNSPLMRAISTDEAAFLIDLGANINVRDSFGSTPLHRAISQNQKGMAELLIAKGADINARAAQGGGTPLHRAVADNRIECLELLLTSGAKIDAKDDDGYTPLHRAVADNRIECLELLLTSGAKIDAKDDDGYTPLHRAVAGFPYSKNRPIVELLISKGSDINAINNAGYTPLQTSIEYCGGIEECSKKEMFDLLIARGANIEAGSSGMSALQIALVNNRKNMADVLIAKGAGGAGSDVNLRDRDGKTALHKAADWNNVEAARELIGKGADVNARDNSGSTPLHVAANAGGLEVAEILIANGADINAVDKSGATPLFWAMAAAATRPARAAKYMAVFSLLIEKGVNINAGYKDGWTFLHDAVANGNKEAVEILLKKGVDVNYRNRNGKTPLQMATETNKTEIAELLKKYGAQ